MLCKLCSNVYDVFTLTHITLLRTGHTLKCPKKLVLNKLVQIFCSQVVKRVETFFTKKIAVCFEINVLIHLANPKSWPVGIIVFEHVVRPSTLFKSSKTKQQKTMFATGVTVGLAEWIIDDNCLVFFFLLLLFLPIFCQVSRNL